MPNDSLPSLTPEQIAAVAAGDGFAYWEDPKTHRMYLIVDESVAPAFRDEYVRVKIAEADAEFARGEGEPWNLEAMKTQLRDRYAKRKA